MEEALATLALSTEERHHAMIEQLVNVEQLQNKEQDTAFWLEFIGGVLGFLGIGYIYSGLTNAGLIRLVGIWAFIFVAGSIAWFLTGSLIIPILFVVVVNMALAYFSARDLKQSILLAKAAQMVDEDDDDFIGYLESGSDEGTAPPFQKRNQSRNRR